MEVLCVLQTWGVKHLRSLVISFDVAIGKIEAVVGTDITVATAGESGEVTDALRLVFGDVTDTMAFTGDYLDGVLVVGVGRFGFQGGGVTIEFCLSLKYIIAELCAIAMVIGSLAVCDGGCIEVEKFCRRHGLLLPRNAVTILWIYLVFT